MIIQGIQTNNLKNLNFKTDAPEIIGVCGVSGGGKSSFAYDTIYQLCSNAFVSLENGYYDNNKYKIDHFDKLLPSVAIKQLNNNTNIHSTIYSYLNLPSLLSNNVEIPYRLLKLNNPLNKCNKCYGYGNVFEIDDALLFKNVPLAQIPFMPWKSDKYGNNKYEILLCEFCNSENIDLNKKIDELSKHDKDLILFGKSNKTFNVKFKHNKKARTQKIFYTGMIRWIMDKNSTNKISDTKYYQQFCSNKICPACNGSKIDIRTYHDINLGKLNFVDFLTLSIGEIVELYDKNNIGEVFDVLSSLNNIGIGYLSLNRSIPTLSGGELQKLNFANIIHSKMSNLLIVFDEISRGLHYSDFDMFLKHIKQLRNNGNIVILIEHNDYFLKFCDRTICIGPKSGEDGGYIIEHSFNKVSMQINQQQRSSFIEFKNISYNNIKNQQIRLATNAINAIIGKSGSGKSSIAYYIANNNATKTAFISQKNLKGNIKSTIASFLEINKNIAAIYAKKYNKEISYFMPNSGTEIICSNCSGTGTVKYERGFEIDIEIVCPQCNGKLFNDGAEQYNFEGVSIADFYNSHIHKLQPNNKINKFNIFLKLATDLSLSHLSLNRKINTLSGGELKRIKMLKTFLNTKLHDKILIIDEPCAGLDTTSANKVINLLQEIKTRALSIVIIEHKIDIFLQADYIIEMGPGSGSNGGKVIFCDYPSKYYTTHKDDIKRYV